jgi:hypothetical protein
MPEGLKPGMSSNLQLPVLEENPITTDLFVVKEVDHAFLLNKDLSISFSFVK